MRNAVYFYGFLYPPNENGKKKLMVFHNTDYPYHNGGDNSYHHSNREEVHSTRQEEQKDREKGRIPRANSDLSHTCSSA
jgi:hypothetical protein